jgi:uncharacterized protein YgiM (DUF1202 family)
MHKFISTVAMAAIIASTASIPAFAGTGSGVGSVVNCDAGGNRQAQGAVIGALAGAVIGNNVSHKKSAPVLGALGGAAAGSYVGCQQQRKMSAANGKGQHVATRNVNVRAAPTTSSGRVGSLSSGEAVHVFGYNGNWAHVDMGGNRTGWVSASYLSPTGQ